MKAGWQRKLVGEQFNTVTGSTPSKGNPAFFGGDIPFVKPPELVDGEIFSATDTLTPLGAKEARLLPIGSVLISCIGNLGKVGIAGVPVSFNQQINAILPKSDIAEPRFIFYQALTPNFQGQLVSRSSGTTVSIVNKSKFNEIEIFLPPLEEQQRIVAVLDKAFAGIATATANAQKNLTNARALFDSYLTTVFNGSREGWITTTLENLGDITSSKRIYKNEYSAAGVPFYRTKEIKELANGKALSTELYITKTRHEEIKQKFGVPAIGDILMTAIGTIGEIYIVDRADDFYFKDGNVLWIKRFENVDPYFLKFALRSFISELQNLSHGSAYSALPIHKLKSYAISVPPSDIQSLVVKNIVLIEERLRDLEILIAAKLAALSELKQSFLQKAFAGELT